MKTHKLILIGGTLAGVIAASLIVHAATEPPASGLASAITWTAAGKQSQATQVDVLFVQNAKGVSLKGGKLTLVDVNPSTICFTDRPDRLAGHMPTSKFVPIWSEGKDSFLKDNPNATLSVFNGEEVTNLVVELSKPQLAGHDLSYDVKVLEGTLPEKGGACALFIDIIGCPRTPYSYAGAARRFYRR